MGDAVRTPGWLIALTLAVAAGPAWAEGLAVKTGLWEVTPGGGPPAGAMSQLPADQLSKLTPEQQALVQQRIAAAASRRGQPRKICVTQAMLDKGFAGPDAGQTCTRTVVSSSSTEIEARLVCTGEHQATGTFKIEAANATTVNAVVDMLVTMRDGKTMPFHRTMQGKWLADDCGDVKPRE
jgi:hypothetical protein